MAGNSFIPLKTGSCWSCRGVNQRPSARQTGAYPVELTTNQAALESF